MPQQLSPLCDDRLFVPTFDKRPVEHDSGSLFPQKSTPPTSKQMFSPTSAHQNV